MNKSEKVIRNFLSIKNKTEVSQIGQIDYIYLINLDKRPEKFERCRQQLSSFDIQPHRISAIDGWTLLQEAFNDIAMEILPGMNFDRPIHFRPVAGGVRGNDLDTFSVGRSCVHYTMAAGALGCSLSHLSILYDAYLAGYETIWILEDDITVQEDPEIFSALLLRLDQFAGRDGWDLLYTDNDDHFVSSTILSHLGGGCWGRPGVPVTSKLLEYQLIGSEFYKIGGRTQTHSMIIRRSGIDKILRYLLNEGIFRPYDIELAFVPELRMFNLARDIVHGRDRTISDTFYKNP